MSYQAGFPPLPSPRLQFWRLVCLRTAIGLVCQHKCLRKGFPKKLWRVREEFLEWPRRIDSSRNDLPHTLDFLDSQHARLTSTYPLSRIEGQIDIIRSFRTFHTRWRPRSLRAAHGCTCITLRIEWY